MTEEEIKKFAKEYVQNNTDESVNSFIGEQLQKAFIEGTDFMYYSNNEELKKELTEKDKQIAELEEKISILLSCKNCPDNKGGLLCQKEYEDKCLAQKIQYIKELKKENTELKEKLNNLASVAEERLANWQKYEKENKEAKEIIKKFSEFANLEVEYDPEHPQEHTDLWNELCKEAEQFLKECEE